MVKQSWIYNQTNSCVRISTCKVIHRAECTCTNAGHILQSQGEPWLPIYGIAFSSLGGGACSVFATCGRNQVRSVSLPENFGVWLFGGQLNQHCKGRKPAPLVYACMCKLTGYSL